MNLATCIGCGCDDDNACLDSSTGTGCHWLRVDRAAGLGVCSNCLEHVKRWDEGNRALFDRDPDDFEDLDDPDSNEFDGEPRRLILPGDPDYCL